MRFREKAKREKAKHVTIVGNQDILRGNVGNLKEEEKEVTREVTKEAVMGKGKETTTGVTKEKEKGEVKEQEKDMVINGLVINVGLWVIKQMNVGFVVATGSPKQESGCQ